MAYPNTIQAGLASGIWGASLPGQENAGASVTDRDTLFLTQFGGEIARYFKENLAFLPTVSRMQFRGKSIQLPYFGDAQVGFQGSMVNMLDPANGLLSSVRGADRFMYVDKPMVNGFVVDEWDELISHLPTRMIYAEEMGHAQARAVDNIIARNICIGANVAADAIFIGHPGGNTYSDDDIGYSLVQGSATPTAANLAIALKEMKVKFDNKRVPKAGRKVAMSPSNYQLLADNKDLFDVDYTPGGNGNFAQGEIRAAYGFEIVVTTNGPFAGNTTTAPSSSAGSKTVGNYTLALGDNAASSSQVFSGTGFAGSGVAYGAASQTAITDARTNQQLLTSAGNSYAFNASKLVAICWAPRAVAFGTARGLKIEHDYKTEFGGTLVRVSQINGCTYWHPECCGTIVNAN